MAKAFDGIEETLYIEAQARVLGVELSAALGIQPFESDNYEVVCKFSFMEPYLSTFGNVAPAES